MSDWTTITDEQLEMAGLNYEAQEAMFAAIRKVSRVPHKQIAAELEVPITKVADLLFGERDLTLTELRYLANAAGVTITYEVRPAHTSGGTDGSA